MARKDAGGREQDAEKPHVLCMWPEILQDGRETRKISISKSLSTSENECCQAQVVCVCVQKWMYIIHGVIGVFAELPFALFH